MRALRSILEWRTIMVAEQERSGYDKGLHERDQIEAQILVGEAGQVH